MGAVVPDLVNWAVARAAFALLVPVARIFSTVGKLHGGFTVVAMDGSGQLRQGGKHQGIVQQNVLGVRLSCRRVDDSLAGCDRRRAALGPQAVKARFSRLRVSSGAKSGGADGAPTIRFFKTSPANWIGLPR
jgi:hypothetical protein